MKVVKSVSDLVLFIIPGFWLSLLGWAEIANASEFRIPEAALPESQHLSQMVVDQTVPELERLSETPTQANANQFSSNKQKIDDQSVDAAESGDISDDTDQNDGSVAQDDQDDSDRDDPNQEEDADEQGSENDETAEDEAEDELTEDSPVQAGENGEPDSTSPMIETENIPSIDDSAPIPIDSTPVRPEEAIDNQLRTADPELGVLILREREPSISRPQQEIPVFLSGKMSFFDTDNAFSGLDPVNDQFWQFGASISATPTIGQRTILIAEAEGTLVRYNDLAALDYNELSLQTSLWHVFASGLYGAVGWQNRQLFSENDGDRFLDEHSLQTRLFYREQLADDLRLDTYYQLRVSFTTPKSRSRILNRLVTSLTYQLTPNVDVGLIHLLSYTDYTQIQRQDLTNQISAQLSYEFSPRNKISLFSGYSFGESTDPDIDFDNVIFGATINVGVRLF
ncbi:MAG: hypothetical protein ACTS2F_00775 [Thainema sp.]